MKLLVFGLCFALMFVFTAIDVRDVSAHPPCGKVWVPGHYNKYGQWIDAHWRHRHWRPGHYNRYGEWIPGHCK